MRVISLLAAAVIALMAVPTFAQDAPKGTPMRVRGTVEKLDGQTLHVKSRDGTDVPVMLDNAYGVLAVSAAKLSEIKKGDFIGAAALKGTDGKLHAQEVLIFPEFARGTGEGHYPWDLTPDSTMTNATVAEVVGSPSSRTLKLKYKDGENEIDVPQDAPIVTFAPGEKTLLAPGAAVFIPAMKMADGSIVAKNVLVGKDGVKPPM